ncbi:MULTISPECIES: VpsP family polysaccharide biosynthesis protein [unclassified Pseudoalteromonas]|uniref:VpsP family polysaccharide biosynthesis protein n=1 Tax=unclassified Pseudoalteromonas TaxID=194690 RepID=UPI000428B1E5|nr:MULTISPECIES: VpsP family polysaccharide biosynthesis protein [unclassified Pseudoalteromonas]
MIEQLVIKRLQLALLAIVTLIICYFSLQSMRANAWYFSSLNTVQELSNTSPIDAPEVYNNELNKAQNAIKLAIQLEPEHAHYLHFLSYIKLLVLAKTDLIEQSKLDTEYKEIQSFLLHSTQIRSSWAETWIELAKVTSYQEGPSKQVLNYIEQAKKVGPYKLEVHLGIIEISLANWQQLPPEYKALYVNSLSMAAQYGYRFNRIYTIAKQLNQLPTLCMSLQFGAAYKKLKQRYIYKQTCK